jgi:hypothetical protein
LNDIGQIKLVDDPDLRPPRIKPINICDLITQNPEMRPVVVEGVLRHGETCNIIASTKVGKSFLGGNLAWCIATGTPWLSRKVKQGKVLIIDNELHPETLADRLYRISVEMQIDYREFKDFVDVIPVRGLGLHIHAIENRLEEIEPGSYTLAILDALYRTLPEGTSENDNAAMMAIYNKLDYYANKWDCAIGVVHHASKGSQGDKNLTDVGSGAGSISRAADTHIVIRPHEDSELCVLECVTRSFKSPEPISIRFDWPLWYEANKDPELKRSGRQDNDAHAKADKLDSMAMLEKIPHMPKSIQQNKLFEQFDFGVGKSGRLIGKLVRAGQVKIRRKTKNGGKRALVFYSQVIPDSTNEKTGDF